MEINVTSADGTRLVVRRTGHGTPLVLVHGSAGGLDSWDPIAPFLVDRFELWVYARRGYAPSDGCTHPKTYADDAADLKAVLTAAGGSAHVVAGSYGATAALHAASPANTGIRSLTLFEPPLFAAGPEITPILARYRDLVSTAEFAAASYLFAAEVARVPTALLPARPVTTSPNADADAGSGSGSLDTKTKSPKAEPSSPDDSEVPTEMIGCMHDLEAMSADTTDIRRWAHINVPVLLMQGSDTWDPMPATMNALAEALPKAKRSVLTGQSHFASHTAPQMFANAIHNFLP